MATQIVEAFSITHAQVLDGSTAFLDVITGSSDWGDVYGVDQGSLEADVDNYDNTGDNVVLSTWKWFNKGTVAVRAGYFSFPLISHLTGATVGSSGAGASEFFWVDMWHEDSLNVAPAPMLLRCLSKDSAGAVRSFDIGLYKVQFAPVTFDGPQYKDGLKVNYGGDVLFSTVDELGATFADGKKRPARIISRPAA